MNHAAGRNVPAFFIILPLAVMLTVSPGMQLFAQGLDAEGAIEAIIGTDVQEEETAAAADPARVIAAIEKTTESISLVRKASNVAKVDIVFLADSTQTEGGPPPEIAQKLNDYASEIDQLRKEVEGNAMLFHAVDSRQILMRDVLAVEFDDANGVVVYAAAKPAG